MSWVKVAEVMRMSEWVVDVQPTGYMLMAWDWEAHLRTPEQVDHLLADGDVFNEVLRIIQRTGGFGAAWTERGAHRKAQKHIASWKDAMP